MKTCIVTATLLYLWLVVMDIILGRDLFIDNTKILPFKVNTSKLQLLYTKHYLYKQVTTIDTLQFPLYSQSWFNFVESSTQDTGQ